MASKITSLEIVSPAATENLTALANEINETHAVARSHAQLAVVFAVRTGVLCRRAKDAIDHGAFGDWLLTNCPLITDRTARKYMALVDAATSAALPAGSSSDTMSVLPVAELTDPAFLAKIEQDAGYRDALSQKVREVVGEGSLSDLYKDWGVVHGPRNVDDSTGKRIHYPASKQKKLSAEQIAKQNRAAARDRLLRALGDFKAALDDKQTKRWLQPKDWVDVRKVAADRMKQLNTLADKAAAALAKEGK